jgi:ligand-binding sensor domain-containing protein
MRQRIIPILFILLSIAGTPCFAFYGPPVKYLGIDEGLSNNGVLSIFQDHNGFMWFGTFDGLNRYDGYSFKVFRNVLGDTTTLNSNYIRVITENANHHLWIGTSKGVYIYNPIKANFLTTTFKTWNSASLHPLGSVIRAIQKNDQDGCWLGQWTKVCWYLRETAGLACKFLSFQEKDRKAIMMLQLSQLMQTGKWRGYLFNTQDWAYTALKIRIFR